jgi:hypothetical protein
MAPFMISKLESRRSARTMLGCCNREHVFLKKLVPVLASTRGLEDELSNGFYHFLPQAVHT